MVGFILVSLTIVFSDPGFLLQLVVDDTVAIFIVLNYDMLT